MYKFILINMNVIVNEVELKKAAREKEKIDALKKEGKKDEEIKKLLPEQKPKKEVTLCKTLVDVQKRKLEKLMSDMTKEVYIPEPRKEWKPRDPAEFVRHVMGSSAGAGSGEFHVYRGIRKRENKRTEYMEKKAIKDDLDESFQNKIEQNKSKLEQSTSKKREKRQRKKQMKLQAKKLKETEESKDGDKNIPKEESSEEEEEEVAEEEQHFVIGGK